jgi:DNA-binding protein HU-beta
VQADLSAHDVAALIDATFEEIAAAMRDEGRYAHPGFGTFVVKRLEERGGMNPRTGERIQIAASTKVRFSPARALVDGLGVIATVAAPES